MNWEAYTVPKVSVGSSPTPPEPVDLSGIQLAIKDLNAKLCDLSEQFNARPETTAIQRLEGMIASTLQRLDELSSVRSGKVS